MAFFLKCFAVRLRTHGARIRPTTAQQEADDQFEDEELSIPAYPIPTDVCLRGNRRNRQRRNLAAANSRPVSLDLTELSVYRRRRNFNGVRRSWSIA